MASINPAVILACGTAATALGGFPSPPKAWIKMTDNWMFQLFTLFILVWQAGHIPAAQSLMLAAIFMLAIFAFKEWEDSNDEVAAVASAASGTATVAEDDKAQTGQGIGVMQDTSDGGFGSAIAGGESYYNPRFFQGAVPTEMPAAAAAHRRN